MKKTKKQNLGIDLVKHELCAMNKCLVCNSCANVKRNSKHKKFGINGCAFFYSVCARAHAVVSSSNAVRKTLSFIYFLFFYYFLILLMLLKGELPPSLYQLVFFSCVYYSDPFYVS
jgi:hypothetical protein